MSAHDVDYNRNILNRDGVELPDFVPPTNHGHTSAAWFLVIVAFIGTLLIAFGMVLTINPMIIAGVIIVTVGLLGSAIMAKAGKGQVTVPSPKK